MQHSASLRSGFINYLQSKQAAGIVNVARPPPADSTAAPTSSGSGGGTANPGYVVHIFPPCEFASQKLERMAPSLFSSIAEGNVPYLVIIITTCQ
jgi:hypothetical protein